MSQAHDSTDAQTSNIDLLKEEPALLVLAGIIGTIVVGAGLANPFVFIVVGVNLGIFGLIHYASK